MADSAPEPAHRPFVDRPVDDIDAATSAARDALAAWGVAGEPILIRAGMNALFGVSSEPAVIRVGRASAPAAVAHELAAALLAAGVPTPPPVEGWTADIAGFAVTGWTRVRETRQAVRWEDVGAAVRRLHDLPVGAVPTGYPVPSPTAFAWWDFEAMLADVGPDLDDPARTALEAVVERHADWRDAVSEDAFVCHGDVHPGNVLTSAGGPLLIDWDLLCHAAPAWDHAALVVWGDRWGGDPDAYRRFAAGYGRDLSDDPLTLALGALRDVAATLLRVRAGRTDPDAAAEAERRLRYWRGDPDAPTWTPQ